MSSGNTPIQLILLKFKEFENEFADELDACHPSAFEVIYQINKNPPANLDLLKSMMVEFVDEYMEDLENCNEDACISMSSILTSMKLS